eukprot:SAG31_NODE_1845_length_7104_cov_2.447680_2_plen_48_part_00
MRLFVILSEPVGGDLSFGLRLTTCAALAGCYINIRYYVLVWYIRVVN